MEKPDNFRQITISHDDIYEVDGTRYFKFTTTNGSIYRDNPCDISKINIYVLRWICRYCGFNANKLKKYDMLNIIEEFKCIIVSEAPAQVQEQAPVKIKVSEQSQMPYCDSDSESDSDF